MQYQNVIQGRFIRRPNRFIAHVVIDGKEQVCHVKNTGRCRELLLPGARVILEKATNSARKTQYDLIAVYKGDTLINMDSQAPNAVAAELLPKLFPQALSIQRECRRGASRLDLCLTMPDGPFWVEVKGVTLEEDGIAMFPDAPTERGIKHLQELMECVKQGERAAVLFLIQMKGPALFRPNEKTHPAFADALRQAAESGVEVLVYDCRVTEDTLVADASVPFELG